MMSAVGPSSDSPGRHFLARPLVDDYKYIVVDMQKCKHAEEKISIDRTIGII
jgi:hypothetical protein